MNSWLQRKLYTCPKCGASYLHDRAYVHGLFECPSGRQDLAHVPHAEVTT